MALAKKNIKILTCGSKKFKKMIQNSIKTIENFGYESIVYDLGELDIGKKYFVNPIDFKRTNNGKTPIANTFKPNMIKDCLENVEDNTVIVYLDGDAFLLKKIDELNNENFDIAITVRSFGGAEQFMNHEFMGPVNSGVIVFKKTRATMKFINEWIEETKKCLTDQVSLNNIVHKFIDMSKINKTIEKDGLRVKLLTTEAYNNYYSDISKAKIRHFKGNIKNFSLNE